MRRDALMRGLPGLNPAARNRRLPAAHAVVMLLFGLPVPAMAADASQTLDLTAHWAGILALVVFAIAYVFVITEEKTHLRKSKPVMLAAGVIWSFIAVAYWGNGDGTPMRHAVEETLAEFSGLFLFLLVAMTYVNAMANRGVFTALRATLVSRGWSYRQLFWATGGLAFFLSPLIDNLTTALVMCAVLLAVGKGNERFISLGCINVVVAANAGGAFSPFGDITTLMVWQQGLLEFQEFFRLFLPALSNFLVPALIMNFAISRDKPETITAEAALTRSGVAVIVLFGATVVTAVLFHVVLNLPPFLGMMTGLGYLMLYTGYSGHGAYGILSTGNSARLDPFRELARAEWDTLLFFFGVIMAVGGLSFIGYLEHASAYFYGTLGPTFANALVGVISAIVDNIPVMVAVLEMQPAMDDGQWLLITLTAGVGGSLLSVGSAAGVALMGQARGYYTFIRHLVWAPAIAMGYVVSIVIHLLLAYR